MGGRAGPVTEPVVVSHEGASTLRLTLNRPDQANAIDATLCDAMLSHLRAAAADGTRIVVIDGNGKNFCGGFDLSKADDLSEGDLLLRFVRIEQLLQLLWSGPFLSVACAHGAVYGAGADLVASCGYRIGAPGCRFRFPGYRFGLALGTRRLGQLVGEQRARNILLPNATVGDAEAKSVGLLTHLEERSAWGVTLAAISGGIGDLASDAMSSLLRNVRQDGEGDRDMARLVASAAQPGIHERVAAYKASLSRGDKR